MNEFSRRFVSSSAPLFVALRRLAAAPLATVSTTGSQGWAVWDAPRANSGADPWEGVTSTDPDGSPA